MIFYMCYEYKLWYNFFLLFIILFMLKVNNRLPYKLVREILYPYASQNIFKTFLNSERHVSYTRIQVAKVLKIMFCDKAGPFHPGDDEIKIY